jgi:immunoglobulin-binding protein 1
MITQEFAILAQIQQQAEPTQQNEASADERSRQISGDYSERLDGPATLGGLGRRGGPLLSSSGKPLQPFTLLDKRSELQKGVFRPGHSLPTMTMDEYLEEERRRGGIIDGGGNANAPEAEPDEDNLELVDAATMKAREWDEFVEANPKGAGNTLNRG